MTALRKKDVVEPANGLPIAFKAFIHDVLTDSVGEYYGDGDVHEIEHEARDGFIPYTNGGYEATVAIPFRHARWEGWNCLKSYEERDYKLMIEEFYRANAPEDCALSHEEFWDQFERKPQMVGDLLGGHQSEGREKQEEWQEEWDEADEDHFFVKCRAIYYSAGNSRNKSGEDEVYLWCGVCLDFNYGRDSGDEHELGVDLKMSEATPEKLAEIADQFRKHLRDA